MNTEVSKNVNEQYLDIIDIGLLKSIFTIIQSQRIEECKKEGITFFKCLNKEGSLKKNAQLPCIFSNYSFYFENNKSELLELKNKLELISSEEGVKLIINYGISKNRVFAERLYNFFVPGELKKSIKYTKAQASGIIEAPGDGNRHKGPGIYYGSLRNV